MRALAGPVLEVIERHVESLGFECLAVTLGLEGGRRVLRVTLDGPTGVPLDACARVSRSLSPLLDDLDGVPDGYYLEVSSPGINRPLVKPEHFRRFRGERAKLKLHEKVDGGQTITGILGEIQDGVLEIETTQGAKRVPLATIASARLHRDLDAILRRSRAAGS